jgi:NhaA family Na+:H+ antiporter
LQHFLHSPVAFFILPVFALANTAIVINSNWQQIFDQHYSIGITAGLIAGKPLGIVLFSFIAVSLGICKLPAGLNWKAIIGVGFLGGIGFTMSIFITLLAFNDATIINNSKFIILLSSLVAGLTGYVFLKIVLKKVISDELSVMSDE